MIELSRREFVQSAAGATAVAGASVPASAQEGTTGGEGGATHTVDMTDGLVFDPETITIAPGDTVVWENVGTIGHSVTAYEDELPADADYFASGGFDSESAARAAYAPGGPGDVAGGESYEHAFEVEGTYGYFCIPHETAGMVGTVEVAPGGGQDPGGGGGGVVPRVPEAARSVGVAATFALLSVLGLAYVFLKYGGDYGVDEEEVGR